ncbi:hypothetical protein GCM10022224_103860 [Nonomuraea antimicrobica]|uniref:Uncharacterized protein n=1 Tax=Nonomuraea antimicrobica TaxID=561173 RepID=A0ABP7EPH6_9ACTN
MREPLNDVRFWQQIVGGSKRTVVCSPGQAGAVRTAIERSGAADILSVVASPVVPDGQAYLVDEQAIEAEHRENIDIAQRQGPWP